jgi:hypothetical protein
MNSNKETSYLLNELFEGSTQAKNQLKHFEREIKLNGFVTAAAGENTAKIYTPQLAHILTSEHKVQVIAGNKKTQISGLKYWQAYFEGFKQGENYFEHEFKPNASTLYGGQVEKYVTDLHNHYWHSKVLGSFEGWASVKFNYPFVLNQKSIKEFGYYSGIVSKADELIKLHQQVFADFDKCQHSISDKKPEVIEQRLGLKRIALIHSYNGITITRENAGTIAGKYGYTSKNSGEALYQDFLKLLKPTERTAIPTAETQKTLINKIELFESVLPHLATAGFQRATDEINTLKSHLKRFEK